MNNAQETGHSADSLDPRGEMPVLKHLEDLRKRLIRSLLAVFLCSIGALYFAEDLFRFISAPLIQVLPEARENMIFTSLPEVFFVYIKVGLFAGFVLALPYLFSQFWQFFSLGLYPHEKSHVLLFVLVTTLFFFLGAGFCYTQVFPWGFRFFIGFSNDSIVPMITLSDYLKFATRLLLVFGFIFEMPVVAAFLARIGILTPEFLRKKRQYAIILIFILAAFLTPPDVVTQVMLAGPMLLLYELSIIAARVFGRRRMSSSDEVS
ncbi:MAG TPA: twin-arginine translocase subunit TatC [bacterium]|nr:twin-arginine translocase subunit TatC [bacterium]